jgi:diaminohydroxyphosphoribosylaminopyrimidine deaminase / 5-amino-6-(5-phosphoribosylamino)uracil reductase
VTTQILEADCRQLNAGFNRWITSGRPWVIAKLAQSLDGRITRPPGESQWLTNSRSRRLAHVLRSSVDAILVGAETIRKDNPRLTVRLKNSALQPWRIVVTRSGNLPQEANVFTDEFRERTIVYQNTEWDYLLEELGARGITRLLVEGGSSVLGELADLQLIDEIWCFIAPLLAGGDKPSIGGVGAQSIEQAIRMNAVRYRRLGNDVLVVATRAQGESIGPL